jgi:hypothetical protein
MKTMASNSALVLNPLNLLLITPSNNTLTTKLRTKQSILNKAKLTLTKITGKMVDIIITEIEPKVEVIDAITTIIETSTTGDRTTKETMTIRKVVVPETTTTETKITTEITTVVITTSLITGEITSNLVITLTSSKKENLESRLTMNLTIDSSTATTLSSS